jgi:hypothetical protein
MPIFQRKAQRPDQVQSRTGCQTKPPDVACVRWNLWLY